MLYEMTVGQRLCRGTADEVMKRILEETIAPTTVIKRDYPPALELIVMKALERRPENRYQSAEDMRHELEEFLDEAGFRTGNRRMALYLREIFPAQAAEARDGIVKPVDPDITSAPHVAPPEDDVEELNFDRRAPLAMRLEAAPTRATTEPQRSPAVPLPASVAPPGASA